MLAFVVVRESVSGLKCLLTLIAAVGEIEVNLHMSPHLILLRHRLATSTTHVLE